MTKCRPTWNSSFAQSRSFRFVPHFQAHIVTSEMTILTCMIPGLTDQHYPQDYNELPDDEGTEV
jgi:hypothetical protein